VWSWSWYCVCEGCVSCVLLQSGWNVVEVVGRYYFLFVSGILCGLDLGLVCVRERGCVCVCVMCASATWLQCCRGHGWFYLLFVSGIWCGLGLGIVCMCV
jgi:hypothetical protein